MGDLHCLLRALSVDPVLRFRQFEQICRWVLENAPEYKTKISRVWMWSDWPGRWGIDAGIDPHRADHNG
jgi:predicted helicase